MISPLVKSKEDIEKLAQKRSKILSQDEQKQLAEIEFKAKEARNKREQPGEFYDGMTYTNDYYFNRRTANTYLRPKKNDAEVRIVGPTTEKALESWQNEMISLNLQPEIRVHDENDNEIAELGDDLNDMVKRTNEQENNGSGDDAFWQDFLFELGSQRIVCVKEKWIDRIIKDRITGKDRRIQRAEKDLMSGLKLFLGDPTIPAYKYHEQPYIFEYDRVSYEEAKACYGHYNNFSHVAPGNKGNNELDSAFDFRVGLLNGNEVEILKYKSFYHNEYQIIINDIPMLPVGTPLDYSYEGYDSRIFNLKGMATDFAYGKPLVASAKVIQAYSDETLRLILRKFQQAIEPPTGVKVMLDQRGNPIAGRVYSKNIWNPGAMTQGASKDNFERLIDHNGVTQSEIAVYNLIDGMVEQFIGRGKLQQGIEPAKNITATQAIEMQKQSLKMLGLSVYALMRAKRDMTMMRVYTILDKYLDPVSKKLNPMTKKVENVYRIFTITDAKLEQGKIGKKIVNLVENNPSSEYMQSVKEEEDKQEMRGERIRYKFLNRNIVKQIPLNFYCSVNQKQRDGSSLDKVLFEDRLNQSADITKLTGKRLNPDGVTEDFERIWGVKDWFQDIEQMPNQVPPEIMMGQTPQGAQMEKGLQGGTQRPSVNTMVNQ